MIRKTIATVFAALLLTAMPVHIASAQTNQSSETDASDVIWSGLWAGANLDVSGLFGGQRQTGTTTRPPAADTPAQPERSGAYVALGDSVAAGAGLPSAANDPASDNRCGRSTQAYPYIVAAELQQTWYHLACSGATAGDLFTQQRIGGTNPAAQLDQAFAAGTPSVITITAGANDAGWADFIRRCYAFQCDTQAFTTLAEVKLSLMSGKLWWALNDIRTRSLPGTTPDVVLTGYYNPLSAQCTPLQSEITASEITWLSGEVDALNQTIKNVGDRFPFVRYADVDFSGHDICSADPWVQGLSDTAPFHPTARGQQAIADAVLDSLAR